MRRRYFIRTLYLILFIIFSLQTNLSLAAEADNYKVVDGIAIYLGIIPAQIILGHPKEHPEKQMHSGAPNNDYSVHLFVALFDNATGKRITNAQVTAIIRSNGLSSTPKPLEPMNIANTITYGNYFVIGSNGEYQIEIQIRRPGIKQVTVAEFQHKHVEL